jgi:protein involved in polysaccharide export with SLBB domain
MLETDGGPVADATIRNTAHSRAHGPAGRRPGTVFLAMALLLSGLGMVPARGQAKERSVPQEEFLPGDAIRIVIPADTGSVLKGVYPIDGQGMADLPIAGRVVVAGKTRPNIEQYLAGLWAPYLKDAHVQATPAIRVAILGNVKNPGYYYPSPDAVIFDAINLAGGPVQPYKLEKTAHLRGRGTVNGRLIDNISRSMTLRESGIVSGDEILLPVPERITMKEAIPLVGTALAIVLNAMTIYFLTVDRAARSN